MVQQDYFSDSYPAKILDLSTKLFVPSYYRTFVK